MLSWLPYRPRARRKRRAVELHGLLLRVGLLHIWLLLLRVWLLPLEWIRGRHSR